MEALKIWILMILWLSTVDGLKHTTRLFWDSRRQIRLGGYGFLEGGYLELVLKHYSVSRDNHKIRRDRSSNTRLAYSFRLSGFESIGIGRSNRMACLSITLSEKRECLSEGERQGQMCLGSSYDQRTSETLPIYAFVIESSIG
jgi:hypothetical protein